MMRKLLLFLFLSLFLVGANAQLDRYQYIVVPVQFDGFSSPNQFRTSTLIKYLFTQEGFTVVYDDKIPADLASKPCKGLRVDMVDLSSLLVTKVKLVLKDCYGQLVFETIEGKSKLKDYELAFREAITDAFVVIQALGYTYTPSEDSDTVATPLPAEDTAASTTGMEPKSTSDAEPVMAAAAGTTAMVVPEVVTDSEPSERLYAQPIENGYQLVDSEPKVRMKLLETSQEDTYIAMVGEAPMGMVYKKDGDWWHEFYEEGKARLKKLDIKF